DSLVQFKPHVLASKAKKAAKNHNLLALLANSNAYSSQFHENSSYSSQSYYVIHPSSVVDYDDKYQGELQGDSQEDKLTTAMMLLAREISQMFSTPTNNRLHNTQQQILEPLSKMNKGNKKQYIVDVRVINYLLQAIPNDIYNSVDACMNAKEMFAAKEGESLESVYERLTTLVSIMDRNNVHPISVSINTKFLNCLQPEWSKYVTMVRHNQTGDTVSYDYNKTPYELIRGRKPNIQYFHVFGSLCYPTNDHDDLEKMKPKDDIEYYETSLSEVSDNFAENTLDNEHTSSSLSIFIEEDEAPQIVSSSAVQVATEPNSSVLNENSDEFV
nr:retrovirus-related Pol polyprotein from transposon TNT 1-94 [Tanacetum cinerariifolium]